MATSLPPRVLTIAGSDSGGGAGIEADLKTFTALQVYGMAAVTAVTAQNTQGVFAVHDLPPDHVAQQIDTVVQDIGVDAAKSGMLSNAAVIATVANRIAELKITNYVLDPVMVSESGHTLLAEDAIGVLKSHLLPLALIVTPNAAEAEALSGRSVTNESEMRDAARTIHELGPKNVLVKGGHVAGDYAVDVLFDGSDFEVVSAPRIDTRNTHGTGCTYSAAIAANLAKGLNAFESVRDAKEYITGAIRHGFDLGEGPGPLNHYWDLGKPDTPS